MVRLRIYAKIEDKSQKNCFLNMNSPDNRMNDRDHLELTLTQPDNLEELTCPQCSSRSRIVKKGHGGDKNKQRYQCKTCGRKFVKTRYQHNHLALGDDVWDASKLGLRVSPYLKQSKLVFARIQQEWLKDATKKFIKYSAVNHSYRYLEKHISHINKFSYFLSEYYPLVEFKSLTREIIVEFISFLSREDLATSTKNKYLATLKFFFEAGSANSWFDVPQDLIRKEDYEKTINPLPVPKYIPEKVMDRLNQHLDELPSPVVRMVLVFQETGLRIGELLQLPLNCLKFDGQGNAYLQYMNWTMNKEGAKPISPELVNVIIEQQQYIKQHLGEDFEYLFSARKPGVVFKSKAAVMSKDSFIKFLKDLAEKFDIRDRAGKRWNFQSHQFRHTVGTRMINSGVPQHIVQRYISHESSAITAVRNALPHTVYADIDDKTLREAIEKYRESRVVNFQGETMELEETILSSDEDLEWFKKTIVARALEHGYCARPKVLGECDIPGLDGCYNCPHWRTNKNFLPILRDTLERIEKRLEKARNCSWELQVKKIEPVKHNLEKVVKSLEAEAPE